MQRDVVGPATRHGRSGSRQGEQRAPIDRATARVMALQRRAGNCAVARLVLAGFEAPPRFDHWVVRRENGEVRPEGSTLESLAISDGAMLYVMAPRSGGDGTGAAFAAGGLAADKLAVDAARLTIDAYRAKTERMSVELDRQRFDSERGRTREASDHDSEGNES